MLNEVFVEKLPPKRWHEMWNSNDARKNDLNDDLFRFDHSKLHENFTDLATLVPTSAVSFHLKRDLVWETKAVAEAFTFFSSTSMILSFSIIKRKWVISVVIIPCVVTFMLFFCIHSYTFSRHFDGYYDLIHFRGEAPTSFVKACLKRYPHV